MIQEKSKSDLREAAVQRAKRKKALTRALFAAILAALAGILVWWLTRSASPSVPDASVGYQNQGQTHIREGAAHPEYNSNPPTSGWHRTNPARLGFYNEELPDEALIHNLEHGEIWISYKPSVPDAVKEQLKEFLGPRVIITKREKNDTDIAIAAWTRLDAFNLENGVLTEEKITRINAFVERWQNRGPERVISQPF